MHICALLSYITYCEFLKLVQFLQEVDRAKLLWNALRNGARCLNHIAKSVQWNENNSQISSQQSNLYDNVFNI